MGPPKFSEFELLLLRSKNHVGTSVLLILAWIAASDGVIDEAEAERLSEISVASDHGHDIRLILNLAVSYNRDAIQLSCEIVQRYFHGKKANLFLEMAVGMAIVDSYLVPTENHILRFLADLLGIPRGGLDDIFFAVTGKRIPEPSDPSKASYWQNRERSQQQRSDSSASSEKKRASSAHDPRTVHAYAILGLEYGTSQEEVKLAYRRLAQIHHPDRFSSLGAESIATATNTFRRINKAYDHLKKDA